METRSKTRQVNLEIQFEGKKRITTTKLELKKAKEKRSMWEEDMQKAVAYCKEHNVRGGFVIRNGICKLIKDKRSINKRLDGLSKLRKTREDSRILTVNEEEALVRHLKNKNRAMQGMNRKETTDLIKKMLLLRLKFNKKQKGGRKYKPLSTKAKRFLKTNNLSKTFWNRLEVYHPDLTRKRQGTASSKRVFACTEEAVRKYFDELAAEMIEIGIFTQARKEEDGVWKGNIDLSRVFNHDEMPQFIDYGVSSNASNELVYCGTGDRCQKMKDVNRECVTIEPFVSLDGKIYCYHVIFPGTCIVSSMAPESAVEKIPNLLVSTTDSGYQDGRTCLASYKNFVHAIKEKGKIASIVVSNFKLPLEISFYNLNFWNLRQLTHLT